MNVDPVTSPHHTGLMGSATSLLAVVVSVLPNVEQWLRISSLAFGTIAAIVSIVVMLEKRNIEKHNDKRQMKSLLIKAISAITGASKSVIEFIIPILRESATSLLKELLPIALDVVSSLLTSDKSGDEKRKIAVGKIKDAAVKEGINASNRTINLAIELALAKLTDK